MSLKRMTVVGCGYVGRRAAQLCRRDGYRIGVVTRSESPSREVQEAADEAISMHWCDRESNYRFAEPPEVLLVSVSHRRETDANATASVPPNDHSIGLENILSRMPRPPRRLIYLSTTGVYASGTQSDWVDEDSPCEPDRSGARNAYAAEQWLQKFADQHSECRVAILRPAGIYGPRRIPNLQSLREARPIAVDPQSYLNLIHVDDLASIIAAVAARSAPPQHRVYNVSDNQPVQRQDYYQFLASATDAPPPIFEAASPAAAIRPRGSGSKRVASTRLIDDYRPWLEYPDYRSGLTAILKADL